MLVAKKKIKENVGEYLIYMFQIEDLIRACNLNSEVVQKTIVNQYKTDDKTLSEIENWYQGLVELMREENLEKTGHLSFITNKINEVNEFHLYLLQTPEHDDYKQVFKTAEPHVAALAAKQKVQRNMVELILDAIYGVYLLKIQGKEITKETIESINKLTALLNLLSKKFRLYETGKIKIE